MKKIKMHIVKTTPHNIINFLPLGTDYHKGLGLPIVHKIVSERIGIVDVFEIGDRVVCEIKRGQIIDEDGGISGGQWYTKTGTVVEIYHVGGTSGFVEFDDGDCHSMSLIRGAHGYPGRNIQPANDVNDNTATVYNHTIRITVDRSIWDKFDGSRAKILSEAMAKIGNASEAKLAKSESISEDEVRERAHQYLFYQYLKNNCKYNLYEVLMRAEHGARMSYGMQAAVAEASAYADGIMNPINNDKLIARMEKLLKKGIAHHPREIKKIRLQRNLEGVTADDAIEVAYKSLSGERDLEIRYRTNRANTDGWQIEILGELPEQIGLCRVVQEGELKSVI